MTKAYMTQPKELPEKLPVGTKFENAQYAGYFTSEPENQGTFYRGPMNYWKKCEPDTIVGTLAGHACHDWIDWTTVPMPEEKDEKKPNAIKLPADVWGRMSDAATLTLPSANSYEIFRLAMEENLKAIQRSFGQHVHAIGPGPIAPPPRQDPYAAHNHKIANECGATFTAWQKSQGELEQIRRRKQDQARAALERPIGHADGGRYSKVKSGHPASWPSVDDGDDV